jgi:hypothetical protein
VLQFRCRFPSPEANAGPHQRCRRGVCHRSSRNFIVRRLSSPPLTLLPRRVQRRLRTSCNRQLCLPHWNISVSPHKPENFLVRFDYPEQRDAAIHAGSLTVGSSIFLIPPWRLETYTRPDDWLYHVRICVERLLLHAWSAEGIQQALGDICVFEGCFNLSVGQH